MDDMRMQERPTSSLLFLTSKVRIGASLYFANVAYVEETLRTLIAEPCLAAEHCA